MRKNKLILQFVNLKNTNLYRNLFHVLKLSHYICIQIFGIHIYEWSTFDLTKKIQSWYLVVHHLAILICSITKNCLLVSPKKFVEIWIFQWFEWTIKSLSSMFKNCATFRLFILEASLRLIILLLFCMDITNMQNSEIQEKRKLFKSELKFFRN